MSRPRPTEGLVRYMNWLSKIKRKKTPAPATKDEELLTFDRLLHVCQTGGQFAKRQRKRK